MSTNKNPSDLAAPSEPVEPPYHPRPKHPPVGSTDLVAKDDPVGGPPRELPPSDPPRD